MNRRPFIETVESDLGIGFEPYVDIVLWGVGYANKNPTHICGAIQNSAYDGRRKILTLRDHSMKILSKIRKDIRWQGVEICHNSMSMQRPHGLSDKGDSAVGTLRQGKTLLYGKRGGGSDLDSLATIESFLSLHGTRRESSQFFITETSCGIIITPV
jgi:hypothetical protein